MRGRDVTPRQLEVMRALVATPGYQAMADALHIKPTTVRSHLVAIRSRMKVESNEQAVYVLTVRGVLVIPGLLA
jgi:DNA-binding NarL/FixJ family response regulator